MTPPPPNPNTFTGWGGQDNCPAGNDFHDADHDTVADACDACPGDDRIFDEDRDSTCSECTSPQNTTGRTCEPDPCPTQPNTIQNNSGFCCNAVAIDEPDTFKVGYNENTSTDDTCTGAVVGGDLNCDGVDGEKAKAIYVRCASDGSENSQAGNGSFENPFQALQNAINCGLTSGCNVPNSSKKFIYVTAANSSTPCIYSAFKLDNASNLPMYGGFSDDFSTRGPTLSKVLGKTNTPSPALYIDIASDPTSPLVISGFRFETGAATNDNPTTIGAYLKNTQANVVIRNNVFVAKAAYTGVAGVKGGDGRTGCTGADGRYHQDIDGAGQVNNTTGTPPSGGSRCATDNYGGKANASGAASSDYTYGGSSSSAPNGSAGTLLGHCVREDGKPGSAYLTSAIGGNASTAWCDSGDPWICQSKGSNGANGISGGHGGGGSGMNCRSDSAAGGAGGGGGENGKGGSGGTSGGSSIAVLYYVGAGGLVPICNVYVSLGGSAGQVGGAGGNGGNGSRGGNAVGYDTADFAPSESGAAGGSGAGGGGGGGGGGGNGGHSLCLLGAQRTESIWIDSGKCLRPQSGATKGTGGNPGTGGAGGGAASISASGGVSNPGGGPIGPAGVAGLKGQDGRDGIAGGSCIMGSDGVIDTTKCNN